MTIASHPSAAIPAPKTSFPEIDRLGMMTRQRCHTSAHAGFEVRFTTLLGAFVCVLVGNCERPLITPGGQLFEIAHLLAQALHLKKT